MRKIDRVDLDGDTSSPLMVSALCGYGSGGSGSAPAPPGADISSSSNSAASDHTSSASHSTLNKPKPDTDVSKSPKSDRGGSNRAAKTPTVAEISTEEDVKRPQGAETKSSEGGSESKEGMFATVLVPMELLPWLMQKHEDDDDHATFTPVFAGMPAIGV
jgi:hypothetical protein